MTSEEKEILLDLLTQRALFGLTPDEERTLAELSVDEAVREDNSLEMAAAAIALTAADTRERMPQALRARILASADEHFDAAVPDMQPTFAVEPARGTPWSWLGWLVAAAACIALAVNIFSPRVPDAPSVATAPTPSPAQTDKPDPKKEFESMLASADAVKATFGPPPKAPAELASVSGDVVWSDAKQKGYMRLRGVPKNDAAVSTYQLWIFDETQKAETPIDGGVFDVTAEGEVIVPIDAKLAAKNPKMFAITAEKPGGVVVSDRKRLIALGQVAKS